MTLHDLCMTFWDPGSKVMQAVALMACGFAAPLHDLA